MEYSLNFQDNILSSSFNSTSKNVLNWIEENREKFDWARDPNAYELTNLFLFGAKYAQEGKNIDMDTLTKMWEIRSKDFENCNISSNNFIFGICEDAYNSALTGKALVNDENSHHALRKMAGIGLYLKQQERDSGTISYNNPQELMQLLQCSKSLKTFHPDLFTRYGFDKNINVLCKLQLEYELPQEIVSDITTAQTELFEGPTNTQTKNEQKEPMEFRSK